MTGALIILDGEREGERFELTHRTSIGRKPINDIALPEYVIDRVHAIITKVGADFVLEDAESSGGCTVNDERVSRRALRHGDRLRVGTVGFRFVLEP